MQEEKEPFTDNFDGEPPRSDSRAFAQDELIACETCNRANPPTRANCLYCGAGLPISDTSSELVKPTLRPLEHWEHGFNVVRVPHESGSPPVDIRKVSDLLRMEFDVAQAVINSDTAFPVARCDSKEEAALVQSRLTSLGLKVQIVSDLELDAHPLTRVRAIELSDGSLTFFPIGRTASHAIAWRDLVLIVIGRRIVRRLEVAERPDKKRGKEVVASRELSTDAERIDIYSNQIEVGWRIAADNFDFSCLNESKTLLASKNVQILTDVLRSRAQQADFDDSYLRIRQSLSRVWPLEQRTESLGLNKPRMGRVNIGAATTSDNELQFTRYSRLLHFLKVT